MYKNVITTKKFNNVTNVTVKTEGFDVVYRLFIAEDDRCVFSLCVSLYEKGQLCDERFVYDITSDEREADRIFRILYENAVTPSSLYECIDAVFDIV